MKEGLVTREQVLALAWVAMQLAWWQSLAMRERRLLLAGAALLG